MSSWSLSYPFILCKFWSRNKVYIMSNFTSIKASQCRSRGQLHHVIAHVSLSVCSVCCLTSHVMQQMTSPLPCLDGWTVTSFWPWTWAQLYQGQLMQQVTSLTLSRHSKSWAPRSGSFNHHVYHVYDVIGVRQTLWQVGTLICDLDKTFLFMFAVHLQLESIDFGSLFWLAQVLPHVSNFPLCPSTVL